MKTYFGMLLLASALSAVPALAGERVARCVGTNGEKPISMSLSGSYLERDGVKHLIVAIPKAEDGRFSGVIREGDSSFYLVPENFPDIPMGVRFDVRGWILLSEDRLFHLYYDCEMNEITDTDK